MPEIPKHKIEADQGEQSTNVFTLGSLLEREAMTLAAFWKAPTAFVLDAVDDRANAAAIEPAPPSPATLTLAQGQFRAGTEGLALESRLQEAIIAYCKKRVSDNAKGWQQFMQESDLFTPDGELKREALVQVLKDSGVDSDKSLLAYATDTDGQTTLAWFTNDGASGEKGRPFDALTKELTDVLQIPLKQMQAPQTGMEDATPQVRADASAADLAKRSQDLKHEVRSGTDDYLKTEADEETTSRLSLDELDAVNRRVNDLADKQRQGEKLNEREARELEVGKQLAKNPELQEQVVAACGSKRPRGGFKFDETTGRVATGVFLLAVAIDLFAPAPVQTVHTPSHIKITSK